MMRDPRDDAVLLSNIMEMVLEQKLYPSAEIVGGILLSRARTPSQQSLRDGGLHAEALSMFADALKGKGEHKRASVYCQQSLLLRQLQRRFPDAPGSAFAPLSSSSDSDPRQGSWADGRRNSIKGTAFRGGPDRSKLTPPQKEYLTVAEVKFMEAQCLISAGESGAAISSLEAIDLSARSTVMNITLGRVYETHGLKKNACAVYKRALRENPIAVEAILPLLEMGVSKEEVLEIIDTALQEASWGFTRKDLPWLSLYVDGHAFSSSFNPKEALSNFLQLERLYPANLGALLRIAKAHMDLDELDAALAAFKKARLVDEMNVELMDCYGMVMQRKNMPGGLNRLANELLTADPRRAEAWVVIALYSQIRGEKEKATSFVDKALELRQNYALALYVKGTLEFAEENWDAAARCFTQANNNRKDIYSYKGLVEAYIRAGKFREAGFVAKEANEFMTEDARTVLLTGNVWKHIKGGMTDNRRKAKMAYEKALRLDPSFLDATLALVSLHMEEKDYDTCIQLLLNAVPNNTRDTLHTKLAEVYTHKGQYDDALESFHFAISLNPSCAKASRGLERLEKLMRGVDPDDEEGGGSGGGSGDADGAGDAGASRSSYGGMDFHSSSPTY